MAEILISDVTNKTSTVDGTGIFDVLIGSVSLNLQDQYDEGRITGTDFATVYLGAMQSALQQSISFVLGKQTADKQAELVAAQIVEVNEKIDTIIAQTATHYESIKSSQSKTLRDNLLNNAVVTKTQEETDLLQSKDNEEIAFTIRQDAESEAKIVDINHGIAIKAQQEFNLKDKNGGAIVTYTYYLNGTTIPTGTTTDIDAIVGPILSTAITDGSTISVIAYDKEILKSKDLLIEAQTLGFASDTKQKILKQMNDGYAVNLSIAGVGDVPESNQDNSIDALTQELLVDVGSSVLIPGETVVPPL